MGHQVVADGVAPAHRGIGGHHHLGDQVLAEVETTVQAGAVGCHNLADHQAVGEGRTNHLASAGECQYLADHQALGEGDRTQDLGDALETEYPLDQ